MEGKRYEFCVVIVKKKIMLDRMEQFMKLLLNTVKYFEFCRQIYNDYFFFFKFLKTKKEMY